MLLSDMLSTWLSTISTDMNEGPIALARFFALSVFTHGLLLFKIALRFLKAHVFDFVAHLQYRCPKPLLYIFIIVRQKMPSTS